MDNVTTTKLNAEARAAREIARTNFGALGRQSLKLIFSWTVDKTNHIGTSVTLFASIALAEILLKIQFPRA